MTSVYPREDVSSNQHVITSLEILEDLRLGVVIKLVEQRIMKDFWILNYGKIMIMTKIPIYKIEKNRPTLHLLKHQL